MKSRHLHHLRPHLLIALLLLIPLYSAEPQNHIEIPQFPFQESFQMSSSDPRFYRLDLSNAPTGFGLAIYVLSEQGSDSPKLFVSHSKEFPQNINDADYTSITTNVVFIPHSDLKDASNFLYIGLLCESPKCHANIITECTKEILALANGEKTNETPNSLNGARSAILRLTIPKEDDIERIVIHIDVVAVSRKELSFLEVSMDQSTSLPLTNIPRRSSWFEGNTIVIDKDSDLFCHDCIYTLNLKFSESSSLSIQALTFQKNAEISKKTRLDGVQKGKENSYRFTGRENSRTEDFVLSVKVHKGKVKVFIDCEEKQPSQNDIYFWSFAVESSKDIIISQRTHCPTENYFILVQGGESSVYSLYAGYEKSNQLFIGKTSPVRNEILPHEEITYEILMPLFIAEEITLNLLHSNQFPSVNLLNCKFATDCPGVLPADPQYKVSNYYGFDQNLPSVKITDFYSEEIASGGRLIKINPQKSGCYPVVIRGHTFSKEPIPVCAYQVTISNPHSSSVEFSLSAEYPGPSLLTIGEPRFDIIAKKNSLYYLLSVPHNPEQIESIQIQLTKFSGDLDIFISKTNKNPTKESHDNIVKLSSEGFIVIKDLPDLSGIYYIGIYASEASSSFSLSATVKTKLPMSQDSAFLLTPGRPQKGVLLPRHQFQAQYYKIFLSEDYDWYGPLRITVNSLSGRALIVVNHNGEFPTPDKYQWESKNHELTIHSNYFDLKGAFNFKKQGLYYVGIFIDKSAPDADLTYYITYSVTPSDSSISHKDRQSNPFHTFLSLNTRFDDVIQNNKFSYFEALVPVDQFPITISKQSDSQNLVLYISTDPKNKYPSQDSHTLTTTKDNITLEACEASICPLYITANQQGEASLYSLSMSSQENSLIALEIDRQIQANIPANNLPVRFYYHAIPSKTIVVNVNCPPGREILIYAKRIKADIESQENLLIEILNKNTAEFTGVSSISVPPLADSDITIVAISVYFTGISQGESKIFTILASSPITQLTLGTPFSTDVQEDRYIFFMVNITKPECALLVSLSTRFYHLAVFSLVISHGENTRPTISNHQFASLPPSKPRMIEINNTDISPLKSMAGNWVIGVHGRIESSFTLTAIILDRKMTDLKRGTPVEMMSLEESSSADFKFYHYSDRSLQINLTKFSGKLNFYMESIDSYQHWITNLPNQTHHKWQISHVSSQSIITIDSESTQGCDDCTYLIKIEAISSSKFSLVLNHLPDYVPIQGGIQYEGLLKPQESTVFLLKKSNHHLDQNLLGITMKGMKLFVMGSENSTINKTNYLWKETLLTSDLRHFISLPSDLQRDYFYLLLENPKDTNVEYSFNVLTKRVQTFFDENVERVYDLPPVEKNYFLYNSTDSNGFSADVIFYAVRSELQDVQAIMEKDLNKWQKLKAKYWPAEHFPTEKGQEEVYLEAETLPKVRSNSSHITLEQRFLTTNPQGKYQVEIVNPWQFHVRYRVFLRKSGVPKTDIVYDFNGKDIIQSDSPKFFTIDHPNPGNWYFWLHSCDTSLDLKIEKGDLETGMVTVPKGNSYLYQEAIQAGPKDVWMNVNPRFPSDQGKFILYSSVFDENEFKNFELKEKDLEAKVTYKNQKEDKNEVTVEFKPIELEDTEAYDEIRYEIWLCPDLLELSTESPLCSEDHFRQRCQDLSLKLQKSQNETAQVSFQDVNYGMYSVKIKATIIYKDRSIKDVEPYKTAHVNVRGSMIWSIFKMFIGINILILLVVVFFYRKLKVRRNNRGVELQRRIKEYNSLEESEEGEGHSGNQKGKWKEIQIYPE